MRAVKMAPDLHCLSLHQALFFLQIQSLTMPQACETVPKVPGSRHALHMPASHGVWMCYQGPGSSLLEFLGKISEKELCNT
jgi:hypothetical protein